MMYGTNGRETRWLLRWVLEQLEHSEDANIGVTLETAFSTDGMRDQVECARLARAVALSGYRNAADRVADPCAHREYVASIHADTEGRSFECWACGARAAVDKIGIRQWSDIY